MSSDQSIQEKKIQDMKKKIQDMKNKSSIYFMSNVQEKHVIHIIEIRYTKLIYSHILYIQSHCLI